MILFYVESKEQFELTSEINTGAWMHETLTALRGEQRWKTG